MKVEGHICEAVLNVVGYQRSGQHGVAGWIMANLPSPSVFLNNLGPMGADELWYIDGKRVEKPPMENPKFVVRGLEGCYRRALGSNHLTVLVVRDIKNHMASIIRHPRFFPTWLEFFRIWEEYAHILAGNSHEDIDFPYLPISFPHWFMNKRYREDWFFALNQRLDYDFGDYKDAGMNAMMASGGGSSFDFEKYRGRASEMAVLSRYKEVELPPIPENLLELNTELFGDIYEDN